MYPNRTAVDIIIPVWNEIGPTRGCIDSIRKNTNYPHRLIIIDNASEAPTRDYLRALTGITLVRNEENLGFVKAINQGLKGFANAPYTCVMNNDTIASAGWLEEMVKVMESNPGIGIVNPSSNTSGQDAPEEAGAARIQELYTCRGFCMLIRCEAIQSIGLFDEIYSPGYFE